MYPMAIDPNRQDNLPTQHTVQVHMHHLCCPCSSVIYPYYPPGYRPPILAQPPPPIARPSYLHHYQYTQLHVNPTYNVPIQPTINQHVPQQINHSPPSSTVDLAFGPPPRDRRNFESQEFEGDKSKNDSILQYSQISTLDGAYGNILSPQNSHDSYIDLSASQIANMPTDSYLTYLVSGCITGEKIAKRNEHRPCFKNIQNLCNRTRSEVVKPNITVSNIHSQGMPWATKDFIFAFVRAINCWCILRGYLGCKEGNLGKIEKEISPEFKACYNRWEKCTKQLTYYLIETFCKLDEANSPTTITSQLNNFTIPTSSTAIPLPKARNASPPQETSLSQTATQSTQTVDKNVNKEALVLKGIPGILHIPRTNINVHDDSRIQTSESTEISPRDEDSDCGSRVYMKPGSYNVPTKVPSTQSNSPRSIEFLETAQNVEVHKRKLAAEKQERLATELLNEKMWQQAKNVTPDFINKKDPFTFALNNSEKMYDLPPLPQQIESWLNNDNNQFDCQVLDAEDDNLQEADDLLQGTTSLADCDKLIKRSNKSTDTNVFASGDFDVIAPRYCKRNDSEDGRFYRKTYNPFMKKGFLELGVEYKGGGLTESTMKAVYKIFRELERTDFGLALNKSLPFYKGDEGEMKNPTDLGTVYDKLKSNSYLYLNEFVHDIRHIMAYPNLQLTDVAILKQLSEFKNKFEELIALEFPSHNFSHITGDSNELFSSLIEKKKNPDDDDD